MILHSMRGQIQFVRNLIIAKSLINQPHDSHFRIRYTAVKLRVANDIFILAFAAHRASYALKIETSLFVNITVGIVQFSKIAFTEPVYHKKLEIRDVLGALFITFHQCLVRLRITLPYAFQNIFYKSSVLIRHRLVATVREHAPKLIFKYVKF